MIESSGDNFTTTTFYKKTYTGLLTSFFSFTPFKYKVGLAKTLIDRAYKINSSIQKFNENLDKIKIFLQRNGFPSVFINKCVKNYLQQRESPRSNDDVTNESDSRFYKLPYIGSFSSVIRKRLNKLISRCCTDEVKIKIIFTPFKIESCFSLKDKANVSLKSLVVYRFKCANCNASYIGETSRHLSTRIDEHLSKDKNSHIFKHLLSSQECKDLCNTDSFVVLDSAPTKYQLKIKEGLYIAWEKPSLNKQLNCVKISLLC